MTVTLSWDLFIIVFFAIVMAYSFIIGKHQSVKVIIAAYISIIATQGVGNALFRLLNQTPAFLSVLGVTFNFTILSAIKIFLFAAFIITLAIRSGIHVTYTKESGSLLSALYTGLFGFTTAGLIVSTILTYVAGNSIMDPNIALSPAVAPIAAVSPLMQIMVLNQDLWFALPALLIIVVGFVSSE